MCAYQPTTSLLFNVNTGNLTSSQNKMDENLLVQPAAFVVRLRQLNHHSCCLLLFTPTLTNNMKFFQSTHLSWRTYLYTYHRINIPMLIIITIIIIITITIDNLVRLKTSVFHTSSSSIQSINRSICVFVSRLPVWAIALALVVSF